MVMVDDSHAAGFVGAKGGAASITAALWGGGHHHRHLRQSAGRSIRRLYQRPQGDRPTMLRQRSRPYLFSNSMAPAVVAASIRALKCW
jgi:glycine C-acetyltransferase